MIKSAFSNKNAYSVTANKNSNEDTNVSADISVSSKIFFLNYRFGSESKVVSGTERMRAMKLSKPGT